jgi:hypothetical protein
MGTGYTTLRPSRRGAGKDETETESDARALKERSQLLEFHLAQQCVESRMVVQ